MSEELPRMTIEYPDGLVYSGLAEEVEITITVPAESRWRVPFNVKGDWSARLIGKGELTTSRADLRLEQHSDNEWRCSCGAIMVREIRKCTECKKWRTFLY